MNIKNTIQVMLLAGLMLMIQSCGGGGEKTDGGVNSPSGQLNVGVQGYFLWSNSRGSNRKLDVSTGRWSEIPVMQDWIGQNKDMRNIDRRNVSLTRFSNNGQFALKIIHDCDPDVGGVLNDIIGECIVVFDLVNQSVISDFKVSPIIGRFLDDIALSDDGQYISILDRKNRDDYRVRIYDSAGNEIDESLYSDRLNDEFVTVDSVEWLPDGRLVFAYGPTIMRSINPLSTSARPLKVFLPREGEPIHLRVSPDGTKIAYALKTDGTEVSTEATLWVMDVDGSNAYQLVEVGLGTNIPETNNPAWSQDGKWIVFQFGGVGAISGRSPGLPSGLLVVPSDAVKARVDYDVRKLSPEIVRISSYFSPGDDDWSTVEKNQMLLDSFPDGRVTWVMPDRITN